MNKAQGRTRGECDALHKARWGSKALSGDREGREIDHEARGGVMLSAKQGDRMASGVEEGGGARSSAE